MLLVFESLVVLPRNNCVLGLLDLDGRRNVMLLVWCKHINLQIAPLSFLGNVDRRWESGTAYTIDSIVMDLLGKQVDNFVHPGNVRCSFFLCGNFFNISL